MKSKPQIYDLFKAVDHVFGLPEGFFEKYIDRTNKSANKKVKKKNLAASKKN